MEAFGWLGQIGDALLTTLPRRVIVTTTEAAVVWHFGKWPRLLSPGWHIYWPLISHLKLCATAIRSIGLMRQTLTTTDGRVIGVSGWLTYRVDDPLRLLCQYVDYEDALQETAAGVLAEVVSESEPMSAMNDLKVSLRKRLRRQFAGSGLVVLKFALSDYMPAKYPLAIWQAD